MVGLEGSSDFTSKGVDDSYNNRLFVESVKEEALNLDGPPSRDGLGFKGGVPVGYRLPGRGRGGPPSWKSQ